MKNFYVGVAYFSFFALIGFAVFWLHKGWPLWLILFTPTFSSSKGVEGSGLVKEAAADLFKKQNDVNNNQS